MACQMGWRADQPHHPDQRCCPPSPGVKSHEQLSTMAAWRFLERPRGGKCSQTASDRGQPRGPSQRLSQVRVPSLSPRPCDTVCACRVRLTQAAPAAASCSSRTALQVHRVVAPFQRAVQPAEHEPHNKLLIPMLHPHAAARVVSVPPRPASAANGQGARLYERAGPQRSGGSPHTGWHRRGVPLLNLVCNNNLNNSRSNRPHHHQ